MPFVLSPNLRNHVLIEEGADTYVSWLPPNISNSSFLVFLQDGDPGGETAFFNGADFLILNGDHREGYEAVYPDKEACTKYFYDHIDQVSSWSEHTHETPNKFMT